MQLRIGTVRLPRPYAPPSGHPPVLSAPLLPRSNRPPQNVVTTSSARPERPSGNATITNTSSATKMTSYAYASTSGITRRSGRKIRTIQRTCPPRPYGRKAYVGARQPGERFEQPRTPMNAVPNTDGEVASPLRDEG